MRRLVLGAAYASGALGLLRPGPALTVVMFHRVVEPASLAARQADPTYTVTAPLFDDLLGFFQRHFSVVSMAQVLAAASGGAGLPANALLITFDDGWADNLHCAAPLLRARGLPAVVFVATEAVQADADVWWQERVFAAARADRTLDPLEMVCRLAPLDPAARDTQLHALPMPDAGARMMLHPHEVALLADSGIAVGLHGHTHLPLTRVAELGTELAEARASLAAMARDPAACATLACPHGRHDARVVEAVRGAGIILMFTSDPVLNRLEGGRIAADRPVGRINMEATHLANDAGRLDPALAARWLWRRALA